MLKFSNSLTGDDKAQKTLKGGDTLTPEKLAALVNDFNELDKKFIDFKDEINEFKKDTKNEIKTQSAWVTGGFIALIFIVVSLLIAVGAMCNEYLLMKQNSYQSLINKIDSLQKVK